ncbi:MAG: hypothetical protein HQ594_02105, partial [Candidatus Omnitrophica bacterium]|nr:hypothetical protein [Candidatus Omnitrophota bacterium]
MMKIFNNGISGEGYSKDRNSFIRDGKIFKEDHDDSQYGMADWKKRHAFFIKCVSLTLALIFFHQQLGWSQNGHPVWAQAQPIDIAYQDKVDTKGLEIPHDIADTQEALINGGDETIINIQDAHASLSAQYSIANLLDSLVTNYDLDLIAIEGATGPVNTSILKSFPDKKVRDSVAESFMVEGYMGAGEFFATITDNKDIKLYGIENDELYQANLESFREVAAEQAVRLGNISALLTELEALEEKACSSDLKELNSRCALHRKGELSFKDYWSYIQKLSEKHKIDFSEYTELEKLLQSVELEDSINFAEANIERRRLIGELSDMMKKAELETLVLKSLAFKQNKISQADFHAYLTSLADKHGVPSEGYANLIKFTRYVSVYESVGIFTLYHEMESFEDRIRGDLYRNDDERGLYAITKMARLLKQLYAVEVTNGEADYVAGHIADFKADETASFIRNNCKKYGVQIKGGYDLGKVFGEAGAALKFYAQAEARNNEMISNTVKRMREEGKHVAALITGGYHTRGLTELMRSKKLSYLVVVPKFESGEERPYVAILTNKKQPYQKILEAGKYEIAAESMYQQMDKNPDMLRTTIFRSAAEAVLEHGERSARSFVSVWADRYDADFSEMSEDERANFARPEVFTDITSGTYTKKTARGALAGDRDALEGDGTDLVVAVKEGEITRFKKPTSKERGEMAAYIEEMTQINKFGETDEAGTMARVDDIDAKLQSIADEFVARIMKKGRDPKLRSDKFARKVSARLRGRGILDPEEEDPVKVKRVVRMIAEKLTAPAGQPTETESSQIVVEDAKGKGKVVVDVPLVVDEKGKLPDAGEIRAADAKKTELRIVLAEASSMPNAISFKKGTNVDLKGGRSGQQRAMHINVDDSLVELDARLVDAVQTAMNKRRTKTRPWTKEEYLAALAWVINHETRHQLLGAEEAKSSDQRKAEEFATIARNIHDFVLLDEGVQEALLWIMSSKNPNGIDAKNFDEILIRAREKYNHEKKIRDAAVEIKEIAGDASISDKAAAIDAVLARDKRIETELKKFADRVKKAIEKGRVVRVTKKDVFDPEKAAEHCSLGDKDEPGASSLPNINWYLTYISGADADMEFLAEKRTSSHRIVLSENISDENFAGKVEDSYRHLAREEVRIRVEKAQTNAEILEALEIDTSDKAPAWAKRLMDEEKLNTGTLKDRIRLIADEDGLDVDVYRGEGIPLLRIPVEDSAVRTQVRAIRDRGINIYKGRGFFLLNVTPEEIDARLAVIRANNIGIDSDPEADISIPRLPEVELRGISLLRIPSAKLEIDLPKRVEIVRSVGLDPAAGEGISLLVKSSDELESRIEEINQFNGLILEEARRMELVGEDEAVSAEYLIPVTPKNLSMSLGRLSGFCAEEAENKLLALAKTKHKGIKDLDKLRRQADQAELKRSAEEAKETADKLSQLAAARLGAIRAFNKDMRDRGQDDYLAEELTLTELGSLSEDEFAGLIVPKQTAALEAEQAQKEKIDIEIETARSYLIRDIEALAGMDDLSAFEARIKELKYESPEGYKLFDIADVQTAISDARSKVAAADKVRLGWDQFEAEKAQKAAIRAKVISLLTKVQSIDPVESEEFTPFEARWIMAAAAQINGDAEVAKDILTDLDAEIEVTEEAARRYLDEEQAAQFEDDLTGRKRVRPDSVFGAATEKLKQMLLDRGEISQELSDAYLSVEIYPLSHDDGMRVWGIGVPNTLRPVSADVTIGTGFAGDEYGPRAQIAFASLLDKEKLQELRRVRKEAVEKDRRQAEELDSGEPVTPVTPVTADTADTLEVPDDGLEIEGLKREIEEQEEAARKMRKAAEKAKESEKREEEGAGPFTRTVFGGVVEKSLEEAEQHKKRADELRAEIEALRAQRKEEAPAAIAKAKPAAEAPEWEKDPERYAEIHKAIQKIKATDDIEALAALGEHESIDKVEDRDTYEERFGFDRLMADEPAVQDAYRQREEFLIEIAEEAQKRIEAAAKEKEADEAAAGEWLEKVAAEDAARAAIAKDRKWAEDKIDETPEDGKDKLAQLIALKGTNGTKTTPVRRFRRILADPQYRDIRKKYDDAAKEARRAKESEKAVREAEEIASAALEQAADEVRDVDELGEKIGDAPVFLQLETIAALRKRLHQEVKTAKEAVRNAEEVARANGIELARADEFNDKILKLEEKQGRLLGKLAEADATFTVFTRLAKRLRGPIGRYLEARREKAAKKAEEAQARAEAQADKEAAEEEARIKEITARIDSIKRDMESEDYEKAGAALDLLPDEYPLPQQEFKVDALRAEIEAVKLLREVQSKVDLLSSGEQATSKRIDELEKASTEAQNSLTSVGLIYLAGNDVPSLKRIDVRKEEAMAVSAAIEVQKKNQRRADRIAALIRPIKEEIEKENYEQAKTALDALDSSDPELQKVSEVEALREVI